MIFLWPGKPATEPPPTGTTQRAYGEVRVIDEQPCPSGVRTLKVASGSLSPGRAVASQRSHESQFRDPDILCLVHDDEIEWRFAKVGQMGG